MALIKCNECGNEISDKAKKCPHCGKKNNIIIFLYFPIKERFWGDKLRKRRYLK